MELRQLRYFVAVVDSGSVSRAASLVHVVQPALSQQMGQLEQELDVQLLHRSVREVLREVVEELVASGEWDRPAIAAGDTDSGIS